MESSKKGFSLIELLLVIAILGVLAGLISGNFINSLAKSRDARRKTDLEQIQKALELYYEDVKAYPTTLSFGNGAQLSHPTTTSIKYMQAVPDDPSSGYDYYYDSTDGTYYKLYSCIENTNDTARGVNQGGYTGTDCGGCKDTLCKYGVSSSNETP